MGASRQNKWCLSRFPPEPPRIGPFCLARLSPRPVGAGDQQRRAVRLPAASWRIPSMPGRNPSGSIRMAHPRMEIGVASHSWIADVQVTHEGIFSMTHRSLWHVIIRTCGAAGGAHSKSARGTVRARAKIVILAFALVSGGLGAAALAWPVHGSSAVHTHVHAVTHQPANTSPGAGNTLSTSSRPWIY